MEGIHPRGVPSGIGWMVTIQVDWSEIHANKGTMHLFRFPKRRKQQPQQREQQQQQELELELEQPQPINPSK